jgi:DNA-binding transcriptional LysR family regulator
VLTAARDLEAAAEHLAQGEEPELRVVIGDLTPLSECLALLLEHLAGFPHTRLHLQFGAIGGPWEKLLQGEADLMFHHVEPGETRFDTIPLRTVRLIPVAAPGFFPRAAEALTAERLRRATQCIIRDTAERQPAHGYYLVEGAHTCTVADQLMKREVILQGVGWGHMPDCLLEDDLRDGRLVSLAGDLLRGGTVNLVAACRAAAPKGPTAAALWDRLAEPVRARRAQRLLAPGTSPARRVRPRA